MKKIYIGSDHAGFAIKGLVKELFEKRGYSVEDLGTYSSDRVDYPDYAAKVARAVAADPGSQGVLICGTGIGMSIAANKIKGIRAAEVHDYYTAQMARAHNDANVLCFGERVVGPGVVESIIEAWCTTEFEGGRHENRVKKIMALEE
ncbi:MULTISPECIES: ribose 5-phosphate isomerase B [Nitratiruptor]|uniref:Ribose 5-phosphate isomerase B n=1 Tax=Nitratiruptor tergarcus DSM 16512 TaxID=1069081 RepID=A0A1W1WTS7_9BACT|nr:MULTISPECIES: ribose 5-phosphate isomerase B [Nitratiruptor]BCD62024.1 ribose 5-phosphate isomerase B [Nitratiruptor sp. YY08-13]BCD65960.1 ribose 5-phosphate isomerase B [Nitratiruptor sp. YY08-26]SMC09450.1 ribose 5-phosphate isomerase B [Nitratiruptor tergarcus DSM 16512]